MDAATRPKDAAVLARKVAGKAADGALMAGAKAEGDEARAGQNVDEAEQAEREARDRFHDAGPRVFQRMRPNPI
jgi:hypothetical protein